MKNEMGGVFGPNVREEKFVEGFGGTMEGGGVDQN